MTEHGSVCTTESFFPRLKRREALTPRGVGSLPLSPMDTIHLLLNNSTQQASRIHL